MSVISPRTRARSQRGKPIVSTKAAAAAAAAATVVSLLITLAFDLHGTIALPWARGV